MAEHGTSGIAIVIAPHPDRLHVWYVTSCGWYHWFTPPPCFGHQANIDAWFSQRRDLRQDWTIAIPTNIHLNQEP